MSGFSQMFPPAPEFTENSLGDLLGRVYLITGGASGVGLELGKMLYGKNSTVYIAARSVERANVGIKAIRAAHPDSKGTLKPLAVDLADLETIKPAVERFLTQEARLHVLVHNAGVMTPPAGSKTKTGHDLEMGTNCLGPFLLSRLLENTLRKTAALSKDKRDSVRTVWVSSMMTWWAPKGGISFDVSGKPKQLKAMDNYMQSKVGDVFLASEFAKRFGSDGIISVSVHPGLMLTELQRHMPAIGRGIMGTVFKSPRFGACTELYAGWSPDVKARDNGAFFIPWGRRGTLPAHIAEGTMTKAEGGTGAASRFYDWCESEIKPYL